MAIVHGNVGRCGDSTFPGIYGRVGDPDVLAFVRREAGLPPPKPPRSDDGDGETTVEGFWSAWEAWGPCSRTCGGGGIRTRTRSCDAPRIAASSSVRVVCRGSDTREGECGSRQCPTIASKTCKDWKGFHKETFLTYAGPSQDGNGRVDWSKGNWAHACDFRNKDLVKSGDFTFDSTFQTVLLGDFQSRARIRGDLCGPTCLLTAGCTHFTWTEFEVG